MYYVHVPWRKQQYFGHHYELRLRKNGQIECIDFKSKADADAYNQQVQVQKQQGRLEIQQELRRQDRFIRFQAIMEQLEEEVNICRGKVRRQSVWHSVKHLTIPLTPEESAHIRKIKRSAGYFRLPVDWPNAPIDTADIRHQKEEMKTFEKSKNPDSIRYQHLITNSVRADGIPISQDSDLPRSRGECRVHESKIKIKNRHELDEGDDMQTSERDQLKVKTFDKSKNPDSILYHSPTLSAESSGTKVSSKEWKSPWKRVPQGHSFLRSGEYISPKRQIDTADVFDEVDDNRFGCYERLNSSTNKKVKTFDKSKNTDSNFDQTQENMTDQQAQTTLQKLQKSSFLNPDQSEQVDEIIRCHPKLWREFGELFDWTRDEALGFMDPNSVQYKCVLKGIQELRAELSEPGDSALERIVRESIVTSHIENERCGFKLYNLPETNEAEPIARHRMRLQDRAYGRMMRSIAQLLRIRKTQLDYALKLRKNRPPNYDRSDYLEVDEQIIRDRQRVVEAETLVESQIAYDKAQQEIRDRREAGKEAAKTDTP